jgi:subtilisin-like proprotein convertase family protein
MKARFAQSLMKSFMVACTLFIAVFLHSGLADAQNSSHFTDGVWQDADKSELVQSAAITPDGAQPEHYRLLTANLVALDAILAQAPMEGAVTAASAPAVLTLPLPDGSYQRFQMQQYVMLEPAFAAAHPELKTYLGRGLDDPTSIVYLSRTPAGFEGMILNSTGTILIDPQAQGNYYISYNKRDLPEKTWKDEHEFGAVAAAAVHPAAPVATGDILHTYRLATPATGEFTQQAGGVEKAREQIVAFVNRLNGVYTRDLSVRFTLINIDNIIYTNPNTDPYSNGNVNVMMGENQANLDNVIGNANYDMGYVFGTNSGGVAQLNALCVPGSKARGAGVMEVALHEMGHELGAGHTFNAIGADNCSAGNLSSESAYEPGAGTTIMSYSGICSSQNLQSGGDDYFHAFSIQEMTTYVASLGNTCGVNLPTGNSVPVVTTAPNHTIPARTAFTLAGQATDADGDPLTFTWEQFDKGTNWTAVATLPNTDLGDNPIFRSYPPTGDAFRTFPSLTNSGAAKGEFLPTTNRTLHFRLTARDGKGGVNAADTAVTVITTAGPFVITSPAPGTIWDPNIPHTLTWNVANTDQAPFNCANVNLLLSTDSGKTFSTLKANTPNNGSATVNLPGAVTTAMIKVACADTTNIYFAVSQAPGVRICAPVFVDNQEGGPGNWTPNPSGNDTPWQFQTDGGYSGSNYWSAPSQGFPSSFLESKVIAATVKDLSLIFVHKYDIGFNQTAPNENQAAKVQIKINGGGWQDLIGFTQKSANYPQWVEANADLRNLVKQTDTFQLRFSLDHNGWSWGNPGWSVDDVLVCGAGAIQPPPPPATAPSQAKWTGGGTDNDWNTAANWDVGQAPQAVTDVRIPAGLAKYPTINSDAAVRNLVIESGATLNMTAGILTVAGNWGEQGIGGATTPYCHDLSGGEAGNPNPKVIGPQTVSDTITIPTGGRLTDLNVFLDVAHTWVGDVEATLKQEDTGTQITLFKPTDPNCSGDNFSLTLDDQANAAVADACTGNTPAYPGNRYQPNQALAAFNGNSFAGVWTLTIKDNYPDEDNGTLNKWCLNVTAESLGGDFKATGGTVLFKGAAEQVVRPSAASTFQNLKIGDGASAVHVRLTSDLTINGNLEIAQGAKLSPGAAVINLAGNWTQAENNAFSPETGGVVLKGQNQAANGNLTFNNLTINAGSTLDMGTNDLVVNNQLVNNGAIKQTKGVNGTAGVAFIATGGYGGMVLNAQGQDLGNTTVTIRKNDQGCTAKPGDTIQRCFTIQPTNTNGRNTLLTFFYDQSEQLNNPCDTLNGYQDDNSGGALPALPQVSTSCNNPLRTLTVGPVTDFTQSAFVLGANVGGAGGRADEPPVTAADSVNTPVDIPLLIDVASNDFDPEGGPITVDAVSQPQHGQTSLTSKGRILYTPAKDFTGADTFTYDVSDNHDNKATGTITVNVGKTTSQNSVSIYLPVIMK